MFFSSMSNLVHITHALMVGIWWLSKLFQLLGGNAFHLSCRLELQLWELMKEEASDCPNLELTGTMSLALCYLNLVNLQKLAPPFWNFSVEFFLNALFPRPRKPGFMEGTSYSVEWDIYKDKPDISWWHGSSYPLLLSILVEKISKGLSCCWGYTISRC